MAEEETAPCFEQWSSQPPLRARLSQQLSHRRARSLAAVTAADTVVEGTGEDTAAVMPAATLADTPSMAASTAPAPSMAVSAALLTSVTSGASITSRISAAAFGARACMPITAIIVAGVGFQAAGVT